MAMLCRWACPPAFAGRAGPDCGVSRQSRMKGGTAAWCAVCRQAAIGRAQHIHRISADIAKILIQVTQIRVRLFLLSGMVLKHRAIRVSCSSGTGAALSALAADGHNVCSGSSDYCCLCITFLPGRQKLCLHFSSKPCTIHSEGNAYSI